MKSDKPFAVGDIVRYYAEDRCEDIGMGQEGVVVAVDLVGTYGVSFVKYFGISYFELSPHEYNMSNSDYIEYVDNCEPL